MARLRTHNTRARRREREISDTLATIRVLGTVSHSLAETMEKFRREITRAYCLPLRHLVSGRPPR